ncbi:MAG: DUF1552 domain-containing protein [Deltaproteobacteria bacterium]|nr:DUF1552 domain-containing protein [Deltaproteobacteria bacterium]
MSQRRARSRQMTRRAVLRGAGGIAIALPLLPELMPRARADGDDGIPCRLFTMTFGLGLSAAMLAEQFDGPLQPLQPFADMASIFTNVDNEPLSGSGTPHYRVAAALFTGVPQVGGPSYIASGPSMEQVMKRTLHPQGVPNVATPELSVGLWSNTGCVAAFTRHWNPDGSPGQRPVRRPTEVFETLFGGIGGPVGPDGQPTPAQLAERHVHRSVLDTVLEDYESMVGPTSPLGAESKARIDNHLASIRDVELQLAPLDNPNPPVCPTAPPARVEDPQPYSFYDAEVGAPGSGAPQIDWEVADAAMALLGRLMALGAACDRIRFGSALSMGAGEYLRLQGQYSAIGDTADFSTLFATATAHDAIFHAYNPAMVRLHQHLSISMLAHMLEEMNALVEPNGRSVLDNSMVLLATEYGENHTASPALHAVLGGAGRFNPGWYDQSLIASDIYHQAMAAYEIDSGIPELWPEYSPVEIAGFRNT